MTKVLWTDGSAEPNPGPGGYAVIMDGKPVRLGGAEATTNIKMEGTAILEAIKFAKAEFPGEGIEIHTDSQFWKNVLEIWAPKWKADGWKKRNGEIKNLELVKEVFRFYKENPVKLIWVRGHVGTEMNELADEWANRAREGERV
ncbi:ribonuclease HI [Candidatus Saccharibacteria bacterium]|nr:ribonuclease HI [Candidatus Saccharibacteria bacterium]